MQAFLGKVTEFIENQSFIQLSKSDFTGMRYKNVQFLEFKNYLCIVQMLARKTKSVKK